MTKIKLKSFAPLDNVHKVNSSANLYFNILNDCIKNPQINNIAITGDLGVGKSSILKTYEKKKWRLRKKRKSFAFISASDLLYSTHSTTGNSDIQKRIEKNLLIQLLSMCKKKDISESHFRKIPEEQSKSSRNLFSLFLFLFIALVAVIFLLIFSDETRNIINILYDKNLNDELFSFVKAAMYTVVYFSGILFLYFLFKIIIKKYNLTNINIGLEGTNAELKGKEVELVDLDTNFIETIYLLEKVCRKSRNIIVIEDLDCYGKKCIPILIKLKHINIVLNNRNKSKVKFIYELKDNAFKFIRGSKIDMYKFFDIIIPIVPKLSKHNSTEILKHWEKDLFTVDEEFPNHTQKIEKFIAVIAPYLFDYRNIIAIENEYIIFKKEFEELSKNAFTKEDRKKYEINNKHFKKWLSMNNEIPLMSFMIYKHFYPNKYFKIRRNPDNVKIMKLLLEKRVFYNSYSWEKANNNDNNNSISNKKLDEKLSDFMTISVLQFIGKSKYYLDINKSEYLIYCVNNGKLDKEKVDEYIKRFCSYNEEIIVEYALSLVNLTYEYTNKIEIIDEIVELIKGMLDDFRPGVSMAYAMALANEAVALKNDVQSVWRLCKISESIKLEFEKHKNTEITLGIAASYAVALYCIAETKKNSEIKYLIEIYDDFINSLTRNNEYISKTFQIFLKLIKLIINHNSFKDLSLNKKSEMKQELERIYPIINPTGEIMPDYEKLKATLENAITPIMNTN